MASKMLGRMYRFEKRYAEAEQIFLAIIDEEPDENELVLHYISLGRLYQLMDQKEDAEKYLNLCLNSRSLFTRSDAYTCLAELYKTKEVFVL